MHNQLCNSLHPRILTSGQGLGCVSKTISRPPQNCPSLKNFQCGRCDKVSFQTGSSEEAREACKWSKFNGQMGGWRVWGASSEPLRPPQDYTNLLNFQFGQCDKTHLKKHVRYEQNCTVVKCQTDEGSGVRHQNHWGENQLQHNSFSFQNLDVTTWKNILLSKLMWSSIFWVYIATSKIRDLTSGLILFLSLAQFNLLKKWNRYEEFSIYLIEQTIFK